MNNAFWNLPPDMRMDILKIIIPTTERLLFQESFPRENSWGNIPQFPEDKLSDLEYLAGIYGSRLELREDSNSGFDPKGPKPLIYLGINKPMLLRDIVTSMSHELAHALQYKLYGNATYCIPNYTKLLSVQLEFELEACRLSYYVYKAHFARILPRLYHSTFMVYRSRENQRFLLDNWAPDLVDDLGLFPEE